jgi:hypothetical protein
LSNSRSQADNASKVKEAMLAVGRDNSQHKSKSYQAMFMEPQNSKNAWNVEM